ncbi:TPA: beta-lactamase family protein [Serratia marcescens]|jgi:CubicO group peptidase (beta-lactamase class C family)|uniref:serine hydrolase domain-containing protein n=1 Tax=Serratia TaxID=613 RepID=UPI0018D8B0CF|nr:serine hydrolase domain-containing protein [Serratia marcescens]MBH2670515.1 beta-lactamase family protein [Serratia marcescens]MBH2671943.1 beta-lactamase family protein [Serratia marcescens]MBH3203870.1 beta-lactamase family protein [Serratia marcescens]MBH3299868.1 beta-lactamase family protein [Serratia marcescens]MDX7538798.1 serine hydrolase domain-containing protein [Serratia marcescens]
MNEYGSSANAIDGAIEQALREKRLVGAVVLVAQGGEIVYHRAAGMADREAGKPMALNTLFRLASVSKPIVSTAALALMAQGAMRLDDPITRWLPNFRPRLADGTTPLMTLRHLMTHTAGLSYRFFQPEGGFYAQLGVSDGMDEASVSLQENVRRIACAPLLAPPGAAWRYSIATDVLGAAIEQASGLPLTQAVKKWVTGPLAMTDTDFLAVDPARLAAAYADHPGEPRRLRQPDRLPFIDGCAGFHLSPARALDPQAYASGGAGMVGSAEDFLRLLETLRQGGGQVLPAEWVTALTTNQIGDLPMPFWPGRGFGLGITVLKDPIAAQTPESVGTWRMGGTYGHSWFVDPVRQLSVVAFTNTALEGMSGAFVGEICQAVYAATGAMQCA